MKLSDVFFFILYGSAFFLILYFIMSLFNKPSAPSTVVVYDETPVYQESVWWPWLGGSYNYWPQWTGWYNGGGDGGYGYYGRRWGPHHGGGYRPHGGAWSGRPYGSGGRGAHAGFGGGRGGFGGGRGGGGRGGGGRR